MRDPAKVQRRPSRLRAGLELEHNPCDPKEGELYLCRTKVVERLLEVRSGSNVQIDRQTQVKRRKTNRAF